MKFRIDWPKLMSGPPPGPAYAVRGITVVATVKRAAGRVAVLVKAIITASSMFV
jgi:hypothetical protein